MAALAKIAPIMGAVSQGITGISNSGLFNGSQNKALGTQSNNQNYNLGKYADNLSLKGNTLTDYMRPSSGLGDFQLKARTSMPTPGMSIADELKLRS